MKNLSKAGVGVGVGVAGLALAKSGGAFKAIGLAFAGLFSHAGAGEVATLAPLVTRSAAEVTALAPTLRGASAELGLLVPAAREEVRALGIKAYLGGAFRDWVPDTVAAFGRLGLGRMATLLGKARSLPSDSPLWAALEREFLAPGTL